MIMQSIVRQSFMDSISHWHQEAALWISRSAKGCFSFTIAVLISAACLLPRQTSAAADYEGVAQILSPKAFLRVERIKNAQFSVGTSLPLIQKNDDYFIAEGKRPGGDATLVAFRRVDAQNRATAWVTDQNMLIFARESEPVRGRLYLRKGENLPVLSYGDDREAVLEVTRYGRTVTYPVSTRTKGVLFRTKEEIPDHLLAQKPTKTVRRIQLSDLEPRTDSTTQAPSPSQVAPADREALETALDSADSKLSQWIDKALDSLGGGNGEPGNSSQPEPVSDLADSAQPAFFRPDQAYSEQTTEPFLRHLTDDLYNQKTMAIAGLISIILIGFFYLRHQNKMMRELVQQAKQQEPSTEQGSPTPEADSQPVAKARIRTPAPSQASPTSAADGLFNGTLDVFRAEDLVRFLHTSSSSGVLNIDPTDGKEPGRVVLKDGEFIHALFRGATGRDAFMQLCSLDQGAFRFQQNPQVKTQPKSIDVDGSTLLDQTFEFLQKQREQKIIQFGSAS